MSVPAPYVNYDTYTAERVNNTPTIIFGSDYKCEVTFVSIVNIGDLPIKFYAYLVKYSGLSEKRTTFSPGVVIEPFGRLDIRTLLYPKANDLLIAYSDDSGSLFDSFVSYGELHELGGP